MGGAILLGTLLAAGLLAALWALTARCLLPVRAGEVFFVLTGCGDGEALERQCRAYLLLKHAGVLRRPLLLADCGLNPAGRALAERLAHLDDDVLLCTAEALPALLGAGPEHGPHP